MSFTYFLNFRSVIKFLEFQICDKISVIWRCWSQVSQFLPVVTAKSFWLGDGDRETYKYDVDSNTWVKEEEDSDGSSLSRCLCTLGKFVVDILAAGGPFLIVLVRSLSLSISPITKMFSDPSRHYHRHLHPEQLILFASIFAYK